MYIKRDMELLVQKLTTQYPAILITGPRQVGKTTMLKKLMENTNRNYVTLDDLSSRELAQNDPAMFFQLNKPPILIDEVQYAPELFPYIKLMIDRYGNAGDFWLTGSQIFKLMQGVQESLAGRVATLSLSSLSQNEIYTDCQNEPFTLNLKRLQNRQNKLQSIDTPQMFERIFMGSMPAIASKKYDNKNIFYSSYLNTYIGRDVWELSGSIDSLKFLRFITAIAGRCGQMINIKEVAVDADINEVAAKDWFKILEALGIIFYLYPYFNNQLKRTVKKPKLYFYDTGLVTYLTKWNSPETLANGAMNGAIFENYVVSEIIKTYQNMGQEPFLYYYRDKDTKEIDIIIESDYELHPIEIKKSASPNNSMIKAFSVLDKASVPRGIGAVICMKSELSALSSQNLIVPAWLI